MKATVSQRLTPPWSCRIRSGTLGLLALLALNGQLLGEGVFTVNIRDTYVSQGDSEALIGGIDVSLLSVLDAVFTLASGENAWRMLLTLIAAFASHKLILDILLSTAIGRRCFPPFIHLPG